MGSEIVKLIEKKCPNCGASLEFNDKDTSCECKYCHRMFEIERDNNVEDQYVLNELSKIPVKVVKPFFLIYFIVVILIIVFVAFNIFKQVKRDTGVDKAIENREKVDNDSLLKDIKDLSNTKMERILTEARFLISTTGKGESNSKHSYHRDELKEEKIILANKKDSNKLIVIFKAVYYDFYHQSDRHTIYIPVVFGNVDEKLFDLANGKIEAPEYYFNNDKTCYYYGYSSYEEAYKEVVDVLKGDYTITEK